MSFRNHLFPYWIVLAGLFWIVPRALGAVSLELYGTFHAMGVIVTLDPSDDPDGDASAAVAYRRGSDAFKAGFPLSRIADTRWVGSLFWLQPGTSYDVRVTLTDPDHGPLDQTILEASLATRTEIVVPAPAKSYYVSPSGAGTACTADLPCSLAHGLDQAGAGEEVVLRGGIYYTGNIDLPRSGSDGAPIVIRGYDGEAAILDGADPANFTWYTGDEVIYHTTAHSSGVHLVLADGRRLFPYESPQDASHLTYAPPSGFIGSDTFTYTATDGQATSNTAVVAVTVAAAGSGDGNGDHGGTEGGGSGGCFIGALR